MATIRPLTSPLEVRAAGPGKGRGVFATAAIARGTILETVPVIVISRETYETYAQYTELSHYTFCWPGGCQAVALGMTGSMWNHRQPPNVGFVRNVTEQTITFSAVEQISPGEECCIDYGRHLWFDCDEIADARDLTVALGGESAQAFLSGFAVLDEPVGESVDAKH